ncbi:MAG: glutamate synthase-related protein, partial [Turicibacter sp.]
MIDHSNCGIGAIANLSGEYSHEIIQQGMTLLKSLSHRGGKSSDGTGDGCGILMQIPNNFYQTKHNITTPFAVMMTFLPNNDLNRGEAVESIQNIATQYKLPIIKEIEVPVNSTILKPKAKACEPIVMQYIFDMTDHEEAILYTVRRKIEQAWKRAQLADSTCYIASCSTQTIVYKGLLTPDELPHYYLDLQDTAFDSNFCIVHQRFSTNTNPSWNLAQPFRYLAHNGEINTVSGNIQWSNAKKGLTGFSELYPICNERHSDSANLDRTLESMLFEHLNLENAVTRLLPKAYEHDAIDSDEIKAYYEYSGLKNEPWDGPAGVIICDGHKLIATLDRNGLRPFRYAMTEDQIILASEIGVLDTPLQDIKVASRIQASEILCVDLDNNTITKDEEVKAMLSNQQPYRHWLTEKTIEVPVIHDDKISVNNMDFYESKFKYTKAEYAQEIKSLLETGKEAIGSFAYTAPLNMLQPQVGLFFDYFKQNFAQVTNPPLDSIREQSVFSSVVNFTSVSSLQDEALTYPIYKFNSPVITKNQFEAIANESKFECATLSLQFVGNLRLAISKLKQEVEALLSTGCRVIILDDQGEEKCMPSLLATSIVQSVLVESGRRLEVRLVVKCADARLPIHYAMLVAYGADVVYPYFAFDFLKTKAASLEDELAVSLDRYLEGCNQALLKLMAKMGVATVASYRGSKVYEVVGLDDEMTSLFTAKPSLFGGVSMDEIDASLALENNFDLNKINEYQNMDSTFMNHAYSKGFIKDVKECISGENFDRFKEIMASERRRHINIRDCFDYKLANAVKIDEVQSETEIIKHFVASAMSYGALSIEAHETIARAFNELGAASNSGEGGELVERFGTLAASKVKQVASGRFGVTYDYLRSAQEIQIKMAQGAKPGEGGHLPKQKVDENIARVRYAKQGVDLISPPPHHDIYSIEDLAQLIYDLQSTNPSSLISVKLASLFNVGTIANGVVKAGAAKVVISGFNGGTGASPKSSLKY